MLKKYDIVATVGTYQKGGETKSRFKNVGAMMEKDGNQFLLLDRIFNPAGLPNPDNRDTVLLSLYKPKENGSAIAKEDNSVSDLDDSIPF